MFNYIKIFKNQIIYDKKGRILIKNKRVIYNEQRNEYRLTDGRPIIFKNKKFYLINY